MWLDFILQNKDLMWAVVILIIILVVVRFVFMFIHRHMKKAAKKTKTTLDDAIVEIIGQPIYWAIVLVGVYWILRGVHYFVLHADLFNLAFKIAWTAWGILLLIRLTRGLMDWYIRDFAQNGKIKIEPTGLNILRKIIYIVIIAVGLIIILRYLGVEITPLVASLGIAGLAVALALQDTLSNYFAGIYISTDRSIRLGEYIELDNGLKGYVDKIEWRTTRVRTLSNNFVIIPNKKLADSVITNYYQPEKQMSVKVHVGVAYHSDLEKVEKVTIDVAKQTMKQVEGTVQDFEPFIRYREFGDSNINFSVILRVQEVVNQYKLVHEFIKNLKKRYDKEKIEIAFPCRNVYMRK
ncbi:MAG: mechanosensitive ion channel family protein [archaeon]